MSEEEKQTEIEFEKRMRALAERKPLLKKLKEKACNISYLEFYNELQNCPIKREIDKEIGCSFGMILEGGSG